jgi:hypothetical protein
MRRAILVLTAFLVGLAGVLLGFWWAPFVAGAFIGLVTRHGRVAIPVGALAGGVAWLLPLAAIQARYGIGPSAGSLAAIMGFDHQGALPVVLTLLVGSLLGLTGAWLASAGRMLISRPEARTPVASKGGR